MNYIKVKLSAPYTAEVRLHVIGMSDNIGKTEYNVIIKDLKSDYEDSTECELERCDTCAGCSVFDCTVSKISAKEAKVFSELHNIPIQNYY